MWKCENCGRENQGNFCPKCGTKMPEITHINAYQPSEQFIREENSQNFYTQENFPVQQMQNYDAYDAYNDTSKNSKKGLIITICVILVCLIVAVSAFAIIKILNNNNEEAQLTTTDTQKPDEPKNDDTDDKTDDFISSADYKIKRDSRPYKNEDDEILIEHYYELAVLEGDSDSINKINDKLKKDLEDFMMDEDELEGFVTSFADPDSPFSNTCESDITHNSAGLFSVKYTTFWFMGGVGNVNNYGRTFDLNTGKEVMLSDLVDGDVDAFEEQLKQNTWEYFDEQYGDGLFPDAYDTISERKLDEFFYCIQDGEILLMFSTYDLGPGAMGPLEYPTGIYLNTKNKKDLPTIKISKITKEQKEQADQEEADEQTDDNPKYDIYENDEFGFYCAYPSEFIETEAIGFNLLKEFMSPDGKAVMMILASEDTNGTTIEKAIDEFYNAYDGEVTYQASGTDWYAISITQPSGSTRYRKLFIKNGNIYCMDFDVVNEYVDTYSPYIEYIEDNFGIY